jgi:hypothetical protein
VEKRNLFIMMRNRTYPDDRYLWFGIKRLAEAVPGMSHPGERRLLAKQVVSLIEEMKGPSDLSLPSLLPFLRPYTR